MVSMDELLGQVLDREFNYIREEMSKALEESLRLIEQRYDEVLRTYSSKIQDLVTKAKEEVEGEKAKLDIENKRAVLGEKNYWISKVYDQVLRQISKVKESASYQQGIAAVLKREVKEGAIVYCAPDEADKISKILRGLKVKAEIREDQRMIGGVRIEYKDVGLVRDYSLDLVLGQVFESLKPKIAEILFGEI
ncbi:MAG: V-type ATP synthase subunit E [Metallosphaera yellowstonensis]|jgi:Archaeal/vacuolar-type H+-ATPase subunit E|uniref:A-type ATP synthase subunit E n=1 Tax=Metallosphaera yellowstonensis MK1 TaxID=671065 RepID=H2C9F9_9CREN|nr:V-type ATP synthase subunit E [Metallosphaera yellowstonensis]EHP68785.1 archaeal/vacuolar-type H+-ATPase subunit E [Metallosphaera yellowstonensis MK1]